MPPMADLTKLSTEELAALQAGLPAATAPAAPPPMADLTKLGEGELKALAQFQGPAEGYGSRALNFLANFDRPRNAIATAVHSTMDDDPETGFFGGLGGGWNLDRNVSWGDVVGIDRHDPGAGWGSWLARGGSRLALDMVLDPLNLLGGAGAVTKGLSKLGTGGRAVAKGLTKLGEAQQAGVDAAGRAIYKAVGPYVGHAAPGKVGQVIERARYGSRRTDDPVRRAAQEDLAKNHDLVMRDLEAQGMDPMAIGRYMERLRKVFENQNRMTPEEIIDAGIDPTHLEFLRPGYEAARTAQQLIGDLHEGLRQKGLPLGDDTPPLVQEGGANPVFMARVKRDSGFWTKQRERKAAAAKGESPMFRDSDDVHREVHRYIAGYEVKNGKTVPINPGGSKKPIIGKPGHPGSGIRWVHNPAGGGTYVWKNPATGEEVPVQQIEATLDEMIKAGMVDKREFVKNPFMSESMDIDAKYRQVAWLRFVDELTNTVGPNGQPVLTKLAPGVEPPPGLKEIAIPGFNGWYADPVVAIRIENLAKVNTDPRTFLGGIEDWLRYGLYDTEAGRAMQAYTRWWRRTALGPHPGFYIANYISDLSLAYLSGVNPWDMPLLGRDSARLQQAARGRKKQGVTPTWGKQQLVPQGTNQEFYEALEQMHVVGDPASHFGVEHFGKMGREAESRYYEDFAEGLSKRGRVGKAAGRGVQTIGRLGERGIDKMLELGGVTQDHIRLMVAIDYARKNPNATFEDIAAHTMKHLIDYGDLTSTEKIIKGGLVPFYTWFRGILGRTLEDAGMRPQKLARLGRFYDFTFSPMEEEERQWLPEYMQRMAPVTGALGHQFKNLPFIGSDKPGNEVILGLSRFVPHGTMQDMTSAPTGFAANALAPIPKLGIELASGQNLFKGGPVDDITGGFVSGLAAPFTGAPHEWARKRLMANLPIPEAHRHLIQQTPPGMLLQPTENALQLTGLGENPQIPASRPGQHLAHLLLRSRFMEVNPREAQERKESQLSRERSNIKWRADAAGGKKNYGQQGRAEFEEESYRRMLRGLEDRIKTMKRPPGRGPIVNP